MQGSCLKKRAYIPDEQAAVAGARRDMVTIRGDAGGAPNGADVEVGRPEGLPHLKC